MATITVAIYYSHDNHRQKIGVRTLFTASPEVIDQAIAEATNSRSPLICLPCFIHVLAAAYAEAEQLPAPSCAMCGHKPPAPARTALSLSFSNTDPT